MLQWPLILGTLWQYAPFFHIHAALMLLRGQLAILSQFPSQVQTGLRIFRGLSLGRGLMVSSDFWVTLMVNQEPYSTG